MTDTPTTLLKLVKAAVDKRRYSTTQTRRAARSRLHWGIQRVLGIPIATPWAQSRTAQPLKAEDLLGCKQLSSCLVSEVDGDWIGCSNAVRLLDWGICGYTGYPHNTKVTSEEAFDCFAAELEVLAQQQQIICNWNKTSFKVCALPLAMCSSARICRLAERGGTGSCGMSRDKDIPCAIVQTDSRAPQTDMYQRDGGEMRRSICRRPGVPCY